jgi:DNA polymerase III subunit alpha
MEQFSNKDFVHWHVHSEFSHFDGLAKINELVLQARKMGFPAMALTDHGNIMGWIKFLQQCRATKDKKGNPIPYAPIKSILGCEFYLSRKMDIGQYEEKRDPAIIKKHQPDGRRGNRHINLYAMNYEGYKNICRLSQGSYTNGFYFDPRIDLSFLASHAKGVMCGSACLSSIINVNLMHGNYDRARKICGIFNEIFEGNFFLEIMYHGISEEKGIIPSILQLSSELNIPVLCTNDSHYIFDQQGKSQEVLLCMSQQRCVKDPSRLSFGHKEFYLKSAQEMAKIFGYAPQSLFNTVKMAERIDTKDIEQNLFGGMRLPKFEIPSEYKNSYDYLVKLAWDGMKKIGWDNSPVHIEALKMELNDVKVAYDSNNYDFSTYFLIVRDYIQYARKENILVGCGRGSGYSSVLLRCMGITYGVDPVKHGLIWERFLGFDNKRYVKLSDFGIEEDLVQQAADKSDLEEDREIEDDLGGVDRY